MPGSDTRDRGDGSGANSRRGKETEEGEGMAGQTKNEQGQIGRLSYQYKLEG